MRLLVVAAVTALLMAGCAALVPEPVEGPALQAPEHRPVGRVALANAPDVPVLPDGTVETVHAAGSFLVDAYDSFHGQYALAAGPDGLQCTVAAGPDDGAIGYLNVCRITRDGRLLAEAQSTDREFTVQLLDGVPVGGFRWELMVFLEVERGNGTGWLLHDRIGRHNDAAPELYDATFSQDTDSVCIDEGGPVGLSLGAEGHNGRAVFRIDLQGNEVFNVANADWDVDDGVLTVTTGWDHDPSMAAEVVLRMVPGDGSLKTGGPCGPLGMHTTHALPYELGIDGVGDAFEGETGHVVVEVWDPVV